MLRLSEAIRLGAMALPEVHGPAFKKDDASGRVCAACAVGSALYARFGDAAASDCGGIYRAMAAEWPVAFEMADCPAEGCRRHRAIEVAYLMVYLFETHSWTREQIADWVESIENEAVASGRALPVADSVATVSAPETLISVSK